MTSRLGTGKSLTFFYSVRRWRSRLYQVRYLVEGQKRKITVIRECIRTEVQEIREMETEL